MMGGIAGWLCFCLRGQCFLCESNNHLVVFMGQGAMPLVYMNLKTSTMATMQGLPQTHISMAKKMYMHSGYGQGRQTLTNSMRPSMARSGQFTHLP